MRSQRRPRSMLCVTSRKLAPLLRLMSRISSNTPLAVLVWRFLVGEHEIRIHRQRAGDRHALLLAAGHAQFRLRRRTRDSLIGQGV